MLPPGSSPTAFGQVETFFNTALPEKGANLVSPVSGTITAVNEDLKDAPEKINADANKTWMLKLDVTKAAEIDGLLSAADYEKFISEETGH